MAGPKAGKRKEREQEVDTIKTNGVHHEKKHRSQQIVQVRPFTADPSSWKNNCVLRIAQFNREAIAKLFSVADEMRELVNGGGGGDQRLKGKLMATLFFENSTRTCTSLQAAMMRLGGSVVSISEATSSIKKGESLEDSIRALCTYVDVVCLRHPTAGAAAQAAAISNRPVINAGDGVGEHPTQALLDLYTIQCELGSVEGKVITMIGDLKNGRTVHSLARLLSLYKCELHFVSPSQLRMPAYVKEAIAGSPATYSEATSFDAILPKTDVLYVTRVQKERFESLQEYEELKHVYIVTPDTLAKAKSTAIVMHPLPRVGEISEECDKDPRAAYFREMENGMYIRMALLSLLLQ